MIFSLQAVYCEKVIEAAPFSLSVFLDGKNYVRFPQKTMCLFTVWQGNNNFLDACLVFGSYTYLRFWIPSKTPNIFTSTAYLPFIERNVRINVNASLFIHSSYREPIPFFELFLHFFDRA